MTRTIGGGSPIPEPLTKESDTEETRARAKLFREPARECLVEVVGETQF